MENKKELDALIQEKLDSDAEFQSSLEGMSEEDKNQAITDKKSELTKQSFNELAEKHAKAEEIAKNQKIRAEKAEQALKTAKPAGEGTPKNTEFSLKDIRALADIDDEDVDEVVEFAKFKCISVTEAKKTSTIQNLLRGKKEERATAAAANTGGSRHGTSKITDESILSEARKGKLPESDDDIARLIRAKIGKK